MQTKPKIIIIQGPTASGKSDLAVELARKFNGEVISADSRQVYKKMDLGSGKITEKEMMGIPHHLLDVANPKTVYSVSKYQKAAHLAISDILKRGKLPIICGGTGFYIQSIVDNISLPEVPPNKRLRKELGVRSTADLFKILKKLDPNRAKEIDAQNPHRLIRAIEIATALGKVPALKKEQKYDSLQIGIQIDLSKLEENISLRLIKRLKKGMVAEVANLHNSDVSWKRLESFGLEYTFIAQFLQGKISKKEMLHGIKTESLKYAKRQMTWFKKDKRIVWIKDKKDSARSVENFLKQS
jgi:tRNA dimethylallyltransferase